MTKRNPYALFAAGIAIFLVGSLWGFWRGVHNTANLMMPPNAVIGTIYYKQLEEGKSDLAQGWFDINVDVALDSYMWFDEHGNWILSRIFIPELLETREEDINRLVEFRMQVPPKQFSDQFYENSIKAGFLGKKSAGEIRSIIDKRNSFLVSKGVVINEQQH